MDTLTHGIVGALIGKAFFAGDAARNPTSWHEPPHSAGRVAIISATIGAMFPDIDVFAGPLAHNSLAIMTWHRNITHSVLILPVWAVLLAILTRWLARRLHWPSPGFAQLLGIYAIALGSHIFLDAITSFGTMVWSPANYSRVAWDWLFIVDLIFTSLALMPQLAAWALRRPDRAVRRAFALWILLSAIAFAIAPVVRAMAIPFPAIASAAVSAVLAIFFILPLRHGVGTRLGRVKWCRVGIVLAATYVAFAAAMHRDAFRDVGKFAAESRLDVQGIAALPLPPSPARWSGLIATPEGIYRLEFNQLSDAPVRIQFFAQPPSNRYIQMARGLRDVQIFLWFARFPLYKYSLVDGQPVVQITDLRFYGARARPGRPRSDARSNFSFQVVFAPDGRVISQGWLEPQ